MNILDWLRHRLSGRGKARHCIDGEWSGRNGRIMRCIDDTATISMPRVSARRESDGPVQSGLDAVRRGRQPARQDLSMVLAMAETPTEVRTEAREVCTDGTPI